MKIKFAEIESHTIKIEKQQKPSYLLGNSNLFKVDF